MKLFQSAKDGGPESTVTGFWLVEIKKLFSVALLRFDHGSRSAFHSHAFHSLSWVLSGVLREELLIDEADKHYGPSLLPILTKRSTIHRVFSYGTTWVLTFRGPWAARWLEVDPNTSRVTVLGHGRVVESLYAKSER